MYAVNLINPPGVGNRHGQNDVFLAPTLGEPLLRDHGWNTN